MDLKEMKKKYDSGEYILIIEKAYKGSGDWLIRIPQFWNKSTESAKLIHKKHEDILNTYLEDNNVEIEYLRYYDTHLGKLKEYSQWKILGINFIENYNEHMEYRLKPKNTEGQGITRVTDFNNTWCEATEETLNALLEFTKYQDENIENALKFESNFYILGKTLKWGHKNCIGTLRDKNYWDKARQIKLIGNDFYYVDEEPKECSICGESKEICPSEETCLYRIEYNDTKREEMEIKEQNSFNKFGFETPDFEGEIWKIKKCPERKVDILLGYYMRVNAYGNKELECGEWYAETGVCCVYGVAYNLTPIKKEWYEIEDNFPCLCYLKSIDKNIESFEVLSDINEYKSYNKKFTVRPATKEESLKLVADED